MPNTDGFVTTCTDTFLAKGQSVTIDTSIHGLTYRVEVFYDANLVDAIEVSCDHLRLEPDSDIQFTALYEQAHQEMLNAHDIKDYANAVPHEKSLASPEVPEVGMPTDEMYTEDSIPYQSMPAWLRPLYLKIESGINKSRFNHSIVLLSSVVLIGVGILFLAKAFLCSNYILETFMKDTQQKVSYLERTEFLCHKLEKQCKVLAKGNRDQTYTVTVKQCRDWCEVEILSEETCAVTLPYFPAEKLLIPVKKEENTSKQTPPVKPKPKNPYRVYPEGKIELFSSSAIELYVANQTKETMHIATIDLVLNQNNNEEIVQFRKGKSTLTIKSGEEKAFKIFLEPTYYQLFEKGKYDGFIDFELLYEKSQKVHIHKEFFFEVK